MSLVQVQQELIAREPLFHRPELGTDYAAMVTPDFWETGASGRRYTRDVILTELARRLREPGPDHWETSDFCCRELAPDLYLLTYTLLQDHMRWSRRMTLWRRTPASWQAEYHQGTLLEPSAVGENGFPAG